ATGIAEKHVLHAGDCGKFVGKLFLQGYLIEVGRVHEPADLLAQSRYKLGMRVSKTANRDPSQGVKITLAGRIPEPNALAASESDGKPGICVHYVRHAGCPKNKIGR